MSDFTFNASALGVGGVLDYGDRRILIPSLASVALAPTGGEGSALAENYSKDGVSFTRAETRVTGYPVDDGDVHTTICDILITNLRVFNLLSVDIMSASLVSTHLRKQDSRFEMKAMYRGVRVLGDEIAPEYDIELAGCATYDDFAKKFLSKVAAKQVEGAPKDKVEAAVREKGPLHGSLVQRLGGSRTAVAKSKGHTLPVPGIGTLHFGELLVKPGRRRVNLIRIQFDRGTTEGLEGPDTYPSGGAMTLGSGDGNGVPVWP